jgi:UDP-glucose 4-epimerase
MRVLVTGSAGHLGEGLVRTLKARGHDVVGLDLRDSSFTDCVGSIADRERLRECLHKVDRVIHTAALHKPHLGTHTRRAFIETNVSGTLAVLEMAAAVGVSGLVFSSTTSVFGGALAPPAGAPAAWIDEEVEPVPRDIYGVTKKAAEDLCELFARSGSLPAVVLRTARFFPDADDSVMREGYDDTNLKVDELLYRRIDLADAVDAHILAAERAPDLGFSRYVVAATTPFGREDAAALRTDAPAVVRARFPNYEDVFAARGWHMVPVVDRVYVNRRAREQLGWTPRIDFGYALDRLRAHEDVDSALARIVGRKGYHEWPSCL